MDRKSLITKGMYIKGGVYPGRMVPPRPQYFGEELEELQTRLQRVKSAIDYINSEPEADLSGDRIEWLLRNGGIG